MGKAVGKIVAAVAGAVCLAVLLSVGQSPMELPVNGMIRALMHNFIHANWAHLAVNVMSLWVVAPDAKLFAKGISGGTLAWLVCSPFIKSVPIGMSDALFCMVGMRVASRGGQWWKTQWFITVSVVLALTMVLPHVSGLTHAVSLGIGLWWGAVEHIERKIAKDYDKAGGDRRHSG